MSWTRAVRRLSQPSTATKVTRSRSDAATRRRRLFLEQLENRSLLTVLGNGLNAQPDSYTFDEDTTLNVSAPGVLSNDDGTVATLLTNPATGSLTFNGDGSFSFTPPADYFGSTSFTYQATEGSLYSDAITVTLNVTDVPEPPPVAVDDYFQLDEDSSLSAGVLGNDQGQSITAAVTSGPASGTVTMNPDGTFTYTPNANYNGYDSFWYVVTDTANQTDDGQVNFTVAPVNDAPVVGDQNFGTYEDTQLIVTSSGGSNMFQGVFDADGDWNFTANFVTQPTHGTLDYAWNSFIYTPAPDYFGADSFTYTLSDGNGGTSNVATIYLTVSAVNDAPVATSDAFTMTEDEYSFGASLVTNDYDIDGPYVSITLVSNVNHGNLIIGMDGWFNYNPAPNYFGTDIFAYSIWDGFNYSNTVTVTLTITEVNDVPIGVNDAYTLDEDTYLAGYNVHYNDVDVETSSYNLVAMLVDSTTNGSLSLANNGSVTYTPNPNFFGEDSFTYRTFDGLAESEITTVTITVLPVNDAPIAQNQAYTLDEDTPLIRTPTAADLSPGLLAGASDVDGPSLWVNLVNGPSHGQVTINDYYTGAFTYIPDANYHGEDAFTYLVSDGIASTMVTANLTVNSVNDAPIFSPTTIAVSIPENSAAGTTIGTVVALDPDGHAVTYAFVDPDNPFVIVSESGEITVDGYVDFEHFASWNLEIIATDNLGLAESATLEVTVEDLAENQRPYFIEPEAQVEFETAPNLGDAIDLADAIDPDGDVLEYLLDQESDLFAIDSQTGQVTIARPVSDSDVGTHVITVTAVDPQGADATKVVFVAFADPAVKHKMPTWVRKRGPFEINMTAAVRDGKTPAEVTTLVENQLRAKLRELAGLPAGVEFAEVKFSNGDNLHVQSPHSAYGEFGFVIGWTRDISVGAVNAAGHVPIDFSSSVIAMFPYYVLYHNNTKQRGVMFELDGVRKLVSGPSDTKEHEAWHATGPGEALRKKASDKDVVLTGKAIPGSWLAMMGRVGPFETALKGMRVGTLADAEAGFDTAIDTYFGSASALEQMAAAGFWHESIEVVNGKEYYTYPQTYNGKPTFFFR